MWDVIYLNKRCLRDLTIAKKDHSDHCHSWLQVVCPFILLHVSFGRQNFSRVGVVGVVIVGESESERGRKGERGRERERERGCSMTTTSSTLGDFLSGTRHSIIIYYQRARSTVRVGLVWKTEPRGVRG